MIIQAILACEDMNFFLSTFLFFMADVEQKIVFDLYNN